MYNAICQDLIFAKIILPGKINNNYKIMLRKNPALLKRIHENTRFISSTEEDSLRERLYCIQNSITEIPICHNCNTNPVKFQGAYYGYMKFCSPKCAQVNSETRENHKNIMKERYGMEYAGQTEEQKNKRRQTCIERYGANHHWKNQEIQEKRKKTFQKHYGVTNPQQKHIPYPIREQLGDQQWLEEQHHNIKKTLRKIGDECGVDCTTVGNYCRKLGIEIKNFRISTQELEICEFLQTSGITVNRNVRNIIPGEIDIFLPEYSIAIEFDGIFWHSDLVGRHKMYHISKTLQAAQRGIFLIHIWENEWVMKRNIVESRILNLLGHNPTIYARKCKLIEITPPNARAFIDRYHIQGYARSKVQLALVYENDIVAVMTFGIPRFSRKYKWELIRYCSKFNVVGGSGKLLHHFIKKYSPTSIVSYSDKRWNRGQMYEKIGFEYSHTSSPNYWYFHASDPLTLYPRIKFQKHKLKKLLPIFDPDNTEWENMINNKYNRIWDCGNDVWVYK